MVEMSIQNGEEKKKMKMEEWKSPKQLYLCQNLG